MWCRRSPPRPGRRQQTGPESTRGKASGNAWCWLVVGGVGDGGVGRDLCGVRVGAGERGEEVRAMVVCVVQWLAGCVS